MLTNFCRTNFVEQILSNKFRRTNFIDSNSERFFFEQILSLKRHRSWSAILGIRGIQHHDASERFLVEKYLIVATLSLAVRHSGHSRNSASRCYRTFFCRTNFNRYRVIVRGSSFWALAEIGITMLVSVNQSASINFIVHQSTQRQSIQRQSVSYICLRRCACQCHLVDFVNLIDVNGLWLLNERQILLSAILLRIATKNFNSNKKLQFQQKNFPSSKKLSFRQKNFPSNKKKPSGSLTYRVSNQVAMS